MNHTMVAVHDCSKWNVNTEAQCSLWKSFH